MGTELQGEGGGGGGGGDGRGEGWRGGGRDGGEEVEQGITVRIFMGELSTQVRPVSICLVLIFLPLPRDMSNNQLSFLACETIDNLPELRLV